MRRNTRIFIIALILEIFGAILPLALAIWISWYQALGQEKKVLMEYSFHMLSKTDSLFNSVHQIVIELESNKSIIPCSKEHIREMLIQRTKSEADLISYFDNGIEKCNSDGIPAEPLKRPKATLTTQHGLEIVLDSKPFIDLPVSMLDLREPGNYDIYVRPSVLTDIVTPENAELAMVYKDKIISSKNNPKPSLVLSLIKSHAQEFHDVSNGKLASKNSFDKTSIFITENYLVAISQFEPFYFVTMEPISHLYSELKSQLLILLPFSCIIAVLIIWLIVYYSRQQLSLRVELIEAIKNHEFRLHYQPIIDTLNNKCHGAEALIRWQRHDGKMMAPDLFIPIAENMSLIPRITDEVVHIIFNEMQDFLVKNPSQHISFNIAASDIQNGRIVEVLDKKFATSKILRNQIWIELTERTLINPDAAIMTLQKLHERGHTILIDDFGTGYSSLSYLHNLPVDILKIDKAFINSIGMEYVTSHVINAIIEMARKLNYRLIAEGVERKAQYDFLKQNDVDYIQGYIFSKPLPKEEFFKFCELYRPE